MRLMLLYGSMAILSGFAGCDKARESLPINAQPDPSADSEKVTDAQGVSASRIGETITVDDVMQSLGMRIWKSRINEPDLPKIRTVVLRVKAVESEPSTIASIEIDDVQTPGTLLVFLQETPGHEYPYTVGINYQGDNGTHRKTWGPTRENPFKNTIGRRSGTGSALRNRPGTMIIECNGTFTGRDDEVENTADAAAIYVTLE